MISLSFSCPGGGWWVRTTVGISRQMYSLLPLATRATLPGNTPLVGRAGDETLTHNRRFTKPVLYQLSYASITAAAVLRSDPREVKGIRAQSPEDGGSQAFRSFLGSTKAMLPTQLDSFSTERFKLQSGLSRHSRKQ